MFPRAALSFALGGLFICTAWASSSSLRKEKQRPDARAAGIHQQAVRVSLADDEQSNKDLQALRGTWVAETLEDSGKKVEQKADEPLTLVLKGWLLEVSQRRVTFETAFTVEAKAKPKRFTFLSGDGNIGGIYDLEGDQLTVCLGEPGKEAPKTFSTKAEVKGTGRYLVVFKRKR